MEQCRQTSSENWRWTPTLRSTSTVKCEEGFFLYVIILSTKSVKTPLIRIFWQTLEGFFFLVQICLSSEQDLHCCNVLIFFFCALPHHSSNSLANLQSFQWLITTKLLSLSWSINWEITCVFLYLQVLWGWCIISLLVGFRPWLRWCCPHKERCALSLFAV